MTVKVVLIFVTDQVELILFFLLLYFYLVFIILVWEFKRGDLLFVPCSLYILLGVFFRI